MAFTSPITHRIIVEHSELPGGVDLPSYKQLGTITVEVRRAIAKKLPVPEQFPDSRIPSSIHQASEKMLKGRAIESSVKLLPYSIIS